MAAAALLAGCFDTSPDPGTDPAGPTIADRAFDVTDAGCGTGENRAAVSYASGTVTVDGSIDGANACYTATLDRASYDDSTDELTVAVVSEERSDGQACAQCIVDIAYTASVTFDSGLPGRVVVTHDGDVVTTDDRAA